MARSVSVPLLLLLLLPLLLSSAVAYEYQTLANVSNVAEGSFAPETKSSASECAELCDSSPVCRGFVYEGTQCKRYQFECRSPEPIGEPAPEHYMARNACPGTDSNPCECPTGFHRYGTRCLQLLDTTSSFYVAAESCENLGAHLAVPRSQEENDQVILAATELQTAPLTKIWLGIEYSFFIGGWRGLDECGAITQFFGISEQSIVGSSGQVVVYSPPGVEAGDDAGGLYIVPKSGTFRPLCQLRSCNRPECVTTDNTAECGNNQTEGKVSDGTEGKVAGKHACGPSLTRPKNGPRASTQQPVSGQP